MQKFFAHCKVPNPVGGCCYSNAVSTISQNNIRPALLSINYVEETFLKNHTNPIRKRKCIQAVEK